MASNELIPLFPSATHPALPISAQILSTLRHLTAPGKGNDLKPEERAALVGVAALLGCERIQSKDLPIASAQKASSVSPAHFRSTLTRCRKLLEDVSTKSPTTSPSSKRSPRKQPSAAEPTNANAASSGAGAAGIGGEVEASGSGSSGPTTQDLVNPLATPKKKYKFSSGIDISSLVKTPRTPQTPGRISHAHEPSTASPLRHSVVRQPSAKLPHPSKIDSNVSAIDELDAIDEEDGGAQDGPGHAELGTPTKKVKYSNPVGVDLENPPTSIPRTAKKRKTREDASAFFALRPGATGVSASVGGSSAIGAKAPREEDDVGIDEEGWMHRRPQETHAHRAPRATDETLERRKMMKQKREKHRNKQKVDWTFSESVWRCQTDEDVNRQLDRIWSELPAWLEANGRPSIDDTQLKGDNVLEIVLNAFSRPHPAERRRDSDEGMVID